MTRKKVFISFDGDNDLHYKDLLVAWDQNAEFNFYVYNGPPMEAIDSIQAAEIKALIRPKIAAVTHFLCIVGKESSRNPWTEWEINRASAQKKKLIAVKIEKDYETPPALNQDVVWAASFDFNAIKAALEAA
jgi:hypothetical protein